MRIWENRHRIRLSGRLTRLVLFVLLMSVAGIGSRAIYKRYHWKRFAVVKQKKLYRSGQLTGRQLESAIEKLGLHTVVSFNPKFADQESEICQSHGVDFHFFEMPSDGLGEPELFVRFLELAMDPKHQPLLVHCQAGVARTGAAIALYRMINDDWTYEKAIEELRSFERHGRCEPSLREHIQAVYRTHVVPWKLARREVISNQ